MLPLCGYRLAFQAIVADPTSIPFQLDLTEAADANIDEGFLTVVSHASLDSVVVSFGNGYTFPFHGIAYSQMWVGRYGLVSFGGPTTVTDSGFSIDARDFVSKEPAIAAWMADWNPQEFSANDGVVVERVANRVHIGWGDPRGIQSGLPGIAHTTSFDFNDFSLDLVLLPPAGTTCGFLAPNPGQFTIAIGNVSQNTSVQLGSGLLGHTPGLSAASLTTESDLHVPQSTLTGAAAIEEHGPRFGNRSIVGYDGQGRPRHYNDISSWAHQSVTFVPLPAPAIGGAGYSSSASGTNVPDLEAVIPAALDVQGGEVITLVGKFHGFNDVTGSGGGVVVIDASGTIVPLTVQGIIDGGSGLLMPGLPGPADPAFRQGEGLVVGVPATSPMTSPLTIRVTYANGTILALPIRSFAGMPTDVYDIGDEVFIRHRFRGPPVRFYGQTYTECFISDNGQVQFGSPVFDSSPSATEFVAANGTLINPQIAALWTDLAPPPVGPTSQITSTWSASQQEERIAWTNFQYFQTITNCGPFSLTFAPLDTLRFDHSSIIAARLIFFGLPDVIIGISDQSVGPDISSFAPGLTYVAFTYLTLHIQSPIASIVLQNLGSRIWSARDMAANGTWSIF